MACKPPSPIDQQRNAKRETVDRSLPVQPSSLQEGMSWELRQCDRLERVRPPQSNKYPGEHKRVGSAAPLATLGAAVPDTFPTTELALNWRWSLPTATLGPA